MPLAHAQGQLFVEYKYFRFWRKLQETRGQIEFLFELAYFGHFQPMGYISTLLLSIIHSVLFYKFSFLLVNAVYQF